MQQQMKKLQDEIKLIEAALQKNNAKKEKSMGEILSLQAKIRSREKLIRNIGAQIGNIDENISQTEADIEEKGKEVEKMKAEYADMLRKSYADMALQNQMVFVLSAPSFYDAIRRYNYLLRVADYRRSQAKQLQQLIVELKAREDTLQDNKQQKESLLEQQTAQKQKMEGEKKEKDQDVAQLQQKEQRLRKQIIEKNKAAQQLNSRIQAIIEDEIKQAKRKAEVAAKKNKKGTTETTAKGNSSEIMPLTPEEQVLSRSFAGNKGRLPWPVTRGHIVSQFGKHEHPALKGVMVENNGVDIKTDAGAEAHAIFAGTVVSVFSLPTTQYCIIIKHGEYFTVYSNIESPAVKPNQVVSTKQSLGKLHIDKAEDLTKVHLEIWQGKDKMDPEDWLAGD